MLYPSEKHGKEEQWGIICDGNLCHVYGRNLTFVLQNSSNRYQSERLCVLQIDLNSYIVFFAKKNLMLNIFSCLFCRIVQLNLHIYFFSSSMPTTPWPVSHLVLQSSFKCNQQSFAFRSTSGLNKYAIFIASYLCSFRWQNLCISLALISFCTFFHVTVSHFGLTLMGAHWDIKLE